MIQRRSFIAGLGALLAAPAIIRTPGLIMPVRPTLILWGDGVHDDTEALSVLLSRDRRPVVILAPGVTISIDGKALICNGNYGKYRLTSPVRL